MARQFQTGHPFLDQLLEVIESGDSTALRRLLNSEHHENEIRRRYKDGRNVMHYIAKCSNIDNAKLAMNLLCSEGVDVLNVPDETKQFPFVHAFFNQNMEVANEMIQLGFDIKKVCGEKGGNLLHSVVEFVTTFSNSLDTYSYLLKKALEFNADVNCQNERGDTALHLALRQGLDISLIDILSPPGPGLNSVNAMRRTPLHEIYTQIDNMCVAERCHAYDLKVSKLMITKGSDVNVADVFGYTPLHFSIFTANVALTDYLISCKAHVNSRSNSGCTALHFSIRDTFSDDIVRLLIRKGADINSKDIHGATPLHYAIFHNNTTAVSELVQQGVNPRTQDNKGRTPIDIAKFFGLIDMELLLLEHDREYSEHSLCKPEKGAYPISSNIVDIGIAKCSDISETELSSISIPSGNDLEAILFSRYIGATPTDGETVDVKEAILTLVGRIANEVSILDPRFKFDPLLSGSVAEGTKCGFPDEFDFLCCLDKFSVLCAAQLDLCPSGFVKMERKLIDEGENDIFSDFFGKNKELLNDQVIMSFQELLNYCIMKGDLFKGLSLSTRDLTWKAANSCEMRLFWQGSIYKEILVSVDMVPAIRVSVLSEKTFEGVQIPPWLMNQDLFAVMMINEEQYTTKASRFQRLSFSRLETALFRSLGKHIRDGYTLAKAMKSGYVCPPVYVKGTDKLYVKGNELVPQDEDSDTKSCNQVELAEVAISSYHLKTCLFHYLSSCNELPLKMDSGAQKEEVENIAESIRYAHAIYDELERRCNDDDIPAFFVPEYNLLKTLQASNWWEAAGAVDDTTLPFKRKNEDRIVNRVNEDTDSDSSNDMDEYADQHILPAVFVKMIQFIIKRL